MAHSVGRIFKTDAGKGAQQGRGDEEALPHTAGGRGEQARASFWEVVGKS